MDNGVGMLQFNPITTTHGVMMITLILIRMVWQAGRNLWLLGLSIDPFDVDSDNDTVTIAMRLSTIDPQEPCDNNRDDDGDGLNNYFENTTGCALSTFLGWVAIALLILI